GVPWLISADPSITASSACRPGTISPAAKTCTVRRPPEAWVILSARFCAPTPRPGKFFGQVVTMRQVILPCAIAGVASAPAAAAPIVATVADLKNSRLFIDFFSLMALGAASVAPLSQGSAHQSPLTNQSA